MDAVSKIEKFAVARLARLGLIDEIATAAELAHRTAGLPHLVSTRSAVSVSAATEMIDAAVRAAHLCRRTNPNTMTGLATIRDVPGGLV
ncbi:hypothetical protein M2272_004018 [Mycobacterium frederiksbergense]|uniref:Uncharacterized protein n=1 Tax=Mycolicibacterium frederiksbergense TaxID=117567 RepID=A0ABT6L4Y7_9MYCO|nr:hypothetical protein [Mycolicibacterium frederiksbergense]MDH6197365.1 hypothetical protein [Mycolicibacterium frederiksbergense]